MTNAYRLPRLICVDGFSFSVQGGYGMYSCHKYTERTMPGLSFKELEIGFPSAEDSLIQEYAESPDDPTGTVYPWVPVEIIGNLVTKHGGIDKAFAEGKGLRLFDHFSPYLAVHRKVLRGA